MDEIEPTVAHCFTGAGMAKPRVHLRRMHESEEPMERSYSEAMEYLKRHPSEMPRKRVDFRVPLGNSMSGNEVGAAAVKDADYPCIDAGEVLPSSEAKGEDKAALFSEIVPPRDPWELLLRDLLNLGRITTPGEFLIKPAHPKPWFLAEDTYHEYFCRNRSKGLR